MAIFYTPLTDFLTKDTLPKEDPDKVILGADFTAEFNAISTAFAGAAPILDPNFNGTVTFVDATGGSLEVTGTLAGGSLAISGNGTIDGNLDVGGTITSDGSEIPTLEDVQDLIQDAELGPISILNDLADVNVTNVVDGETIVWDDANSVWVPGESSSGVLISNGPPANGKSGDTWFDSTDGEGSLYVHDGDVWFSTNVFPSEYPPSAHNHEIADVNGLQDALDSGGGPNLQTFETSGDWVKPAGAKLVTVEILSAGGGGNSGAAQDIVAGSGGAGGGYISLTIPAKDLPDTVEVVVGAGGIGGERCHTSGPIEERSGKPGTDGGESSFKGWSTSPGGLRVQGGKAPPSTNGSPRTSGGVGPNIEDGVGVPGDQLNGVTVQATISKHGSGGCGAGGGRVYQNGILLGPTIAGYSLHGGCGGGGGGAFYPGQSTTYASGTNGAGPLGSSYGGLKGALNSNLPAGDALPGTREGGGGGGFTNKTGTDAGSGGHGSIGGGGGGGGAFCKQTSSDVGHSGAGGNGGDGRVWITTTF